MSGSCSHGIALGECVFPGCAGSRAKPTESPNCRTAIPRDAWASHDASTCGGAGSCRACAQADEGPRPEDAAVSRAKIIAEVRAAGGGISPSDLAMALGVSRKGLVSRARSIMAAAAGFRLVQSTRPPHEVERVELVDEWGRPLRGDGGASE